jgi:hypothetical protein
VLAFHFIQVNKYHKLEVHRSSTDSFQNSIRSRDFSLVPCKNIKTDFDHVSKFKTPNPAADDSDAGKTCKGTNPIYEVFRYHPRKRHSTDTARAG